MVDGKNKRVVPLPYGDAVSSIGGGTAIDSSANIGRASNHFAGKTEDLVRLLVERLGGPHAVIEQLTSALEEGVQTDITGTPDGADEDTFGYCYLRLFDKVEHRDARRLGFCPSVAALRRFSNGRSDPFGSRTVIVQLDNGHDGMAHVTYNGGTLGMRPVVALALLAKDCAVGVGGFVLGPPLMVSFNQPVTKLRGVHPIAGAGGLPFEDEEAARGVFTSSSYITARLSKVLEAHQGRHDYHCVSALGDENKAAFACVPADLPFNIPSPDSYPYSRYGGLQDFLRQVAYDVAWDFVVDLGGKREQTPNNAFWHQSFETTVIIAAYFKLRVADRQSFVRTVVWIREPVPGRPGGVQIPPPPWPQSIPTPVHHAMTRYAGIADWVGSLENSWQVSCRMSLFGIHEPFDPVWWSDYHKTVDVYTLYTRLSAQLREGFNESIFWIPDSGVDDEEEETEVTVVKDVVVADSLDDGYCYLRLFRAGKRAAAKEALRCNPWAPAVVAHLLGSPGHWSTNTFSLTIRRVNHGSAAYQQGHVTEADGGLPVSALVGLLSGTIRLGASNDLNALMDIQGEEQVAVQPTVFPTNPIGGGSGLELSFNFYGLLGKDVLKYPSINFDILREPAFALLLGSFESVQLVRAVFHMEVATGAQNAVWAAIAGPSTSLNAESDWLAATINMVVRGSDAGYVRATMHLPDVHPFEKELRASSSVGNPPPTFRFSFAGSGGGTASVKGQFVVRVRGQYPLGHIRVGAPLVGKSLTKQVKRIVLSLPQFVTGETNSPDDDEEEDDDESEDEAPAQKSPPRAAASVARSAAR